MRNTLNFIAGDNYATPAVLEEVQAPFLGIHVEFTESRLTKLNTCRLRGKYRDPAFWRVSFD
jgi:hypothetical protein